MHVSSVRCLSIALLVGGSLCGLAGCEGDLFIDNYDGFTIQNNTANNASNNTTNNTANNSANNTANNSTNNASNNTANNSANNAAGNGTIGSECGDRSECVGSDGMLGGAGAICAKAPLYPGGYCTRVGCAPGDCSTGSGLCLIGGLNGDGTNTCVKTCRMQGDCRTGYKCESFDEQNIKACIPSSSQTGLLRVDGAPCSKDNECQGGTCLSDGSGWPQGHCTTSGCVSTQSCATDGSAITKCLNTPEAANICLRSCTTDANCRAGYTCEPSANTERACVPGSGGPDTGPGPDGLGTDYAAYPFPITCGPPSGSQFVHDFNIVAGTTSYFTGAFSSAGSMSPTSIRSGATTVASFSGEQQFQQITSLLLQTAAPVLMPAAPQYAAQVRPGAHQLVVQSQGSASVCGYTITESTPGQVIDVNIYLVGVPGVTAQSAPTDPNLQATINAFSAIYENVGLSVGEVTYRELSAANTTAHRVIRSQAQIGRLMETSVRPGNTRDSVLSLNVFFVQSIAIDGAEGILGLSQGIPGSAGIHGHTSSGVVFTSEYLGVTAPDPTAPGDMANGNEYTGLIMAHEIGHYMGLFHTTETDGTSDPLSDTPSCSRAQLGQNVFGCPDFNYMMFPLAGVSHTIISANQQSVLQANPLSKD